MNRSLLGLCLKCGKPLAEHRKYTQADVMASQGATYKAPLNGYLAPLSPTLISQWRGHDPMMPIATLDDFPLCDCCGAPILRDGLCGVCAKCFPVVMVPVIIANIIEPDELGDLPRRKDGAA